MWVWGKAGVRGWRQGCINTTLPLWAPAPDFHHVSGLWQFQLSARTTPPKIKLMGLTLSIYFTSLKEERKSSLNAVQARRKSQPWVRDVLQQRRCSLAQSEWLEKGNRNAFILRFLCNRMEACVCGGQRGLHRRCSRRVHVAKRLEPHANLLPRRPTLSLQRAHKTERLWTTYLVSWGQNDSYEQHSQWQDSHHEP